MNKPSENNMAGSDKITKMGFKIMLIIASTRPATMMTLSRLSYEMLEPRKLAAIQRPKLHTTHLVKKRLSGLFISCIVD